MRIGLISDIHANPYGLKAVLDRLQSCEIILCAGDITGYHTSVNEVFDILEEHDILFILGNHDEYLLRESIGDLDPLLKRSVEYTRKRISEDNLERLRESPFFYSGLFDGLRIKMYHGSPWDLMEEYVYPDYAHFERFEEINADLIILGHTHIPFVRGTSSLSSKIIVNPGSCGQPRDNDPRAAYGILQTETAEITLGRVGYDLRKVLEQ